MSQVTLILLALVVGWVIQLTLSFFQTRRFYSRLMHLKRQGDRAAVGFTGSTWRRKVYAVLVVDDKDNIIHAEKLSGWTVFANLKPVNGLVGLPISALYGERLQQVPEKIWQAFQNAAEYLMEDNQEAVPTTRMPTGYKI